MAENQLWQRYQKQLCRCAGLGISLDISRMRFSDDFFDRMGPAMTRAFEQMSQLEAGQIANPDENRMVGHYWLRAPKLSPTPEIRKQIESSIDAVAQFARDVHAGRIAPPDAKRFTDLLLIGIGGSALGPQLVADALGGSRDRMRLHFLDNTDPDGFNRTLNALGDRLSRTLVLVVSKSGGTAETRNGMLETRAAFEQRQLDFPRHAVAITGQGSKLDKQASREKWLKRFAMWDWVGGRTSVTSAVGLLPAALQGIDIEALLAGAADMDHITRDRNLQRNPAARLALMWHYATDGQGSKDMVILPYKDRLLLFSRYLQQLVMESLGKERDLDNQPVQQGLTVYGNKGSTDQHAFVQQLREGLNNFFATFIVVMRDWASPTGQAGEPLEVDKRTTAGDYLHGFWQGTRHALYENNRDSITIFLDKLDAKSLGGLIALYERAVGYYASLININAYHQPGVEAGKKAAGDVLELQQLALAHLRKHKGKPFSIAELADALEQPDYAESIYHVLEHMIANDRGIHRERSKYFIEK